MKPLSLAVVLLGCSPAPVVVAASNNPSSTSSTKQSSHGGSGTKTYECRSEAGCTVTVNGSKQHYGYGTYPPVVCGAGIVVLGCGCGYYAPASCSCGETYEPSPSCAPASCAPSSPPSCSAPSTAPPSCGSASPPSSCSPSSCGSSCGSDSPPPRDDAGR